MVNMWMTIGKLAITGIASFLFFLVLFFVLQGKGSDGRGPELFGWTSYTILSNSMEPTFAAGDVVIMKKNEEPSIGDVVTFMAPERRLFTHRIVEKFESDGQTYYKTQGDNNNVIDENPIVKEQIVGTHVLTIPKIGLVAEKINQPIGYGLLIVVPIAGYLVLLYYEIIQKKRKEAS